MVRCESTIPFLEYLEMSTVTQPKTRKCAHASEVTYSCANGDQRLGRQLS
jgi:hypothetical protein